MTLLYDLEKAVTLQPTNVWEMEADIDYLFPVLKNGTQYAATNKWNNAINIFSFEGKRIKRDQHFRNANPDIDLSPTIIPAIDDGVFGFGQIRGFALFDLNRKKVKDFRICPSIGDTIAGMAIADAKKRQFMFWIESYPRDPKSPDDKAYFTQLIDLSGDEPKMLKEIEMENDALWDIEDNKFFLHGGPKNEMKVFTTQLEPSSHPMADVFRIYKNQIDILGIKIHDDLPFALITDSKKPGYILTWGDRKQANMKQIAAKGAARQFSPDGKWLIFDVGYSVDAVTYLLPVSEKYPYYLGTPIRLGDRGFEEDASVWTTNPISFVGNRRDKLCRWELTLEAQGIKEKGFTDFHDYIVTKDLEKLTKEKKQGLGK